MADLEPANTSSATVYDTALAYNVSAGVGRFNSSLIEPFMEFIQSLSRDYPYQVLPFTYFASVYVLVLNPLFSTITSPIKCQQQGCVSYLLSGGLSMAGPWVPPGSVDYSLVRIRDVPSVQLELSGPVDSSFQDVDCDVFGERGFAIGIKVCVVRHPSPPGSLRAGKFPMYCHPTLTRNKCLSDRSRSLCVYQRHRRGSVQDHPPHAQHHQRSHLLHPTRHHHQLALQL